MTGVAEVIRQWLVTYAEGDEQKERLIRNLVAHAEDVMAKNGDEKDVNTQKSDGRTDGWTDGQTQPLIEMRERI